MSNGKKLFAAAGLFIATILSNSASAFTMSCEAVEWQPHHFETEGVVTLAESYTYGGQYQRGQLWNDSMLVDTAGPIWSASPGSGSTWSAGHNWTILNYNPYTSYAFQGEGALADWSAAVQWSTYTYDWCYRG